MGWPKGKKRPDSFRAKISEASKRAWADPAVRAKMSEARKAALADPAVRAKMSEASKRAWADPAVRAKMSAASKAALADPAVRAKMSEARKAAWADPAVRAKMSEARKAAWADPAVRAKMSAASKRAWAARCVYCDASRSKFVQLVNDGPDLWACLDERACERRIERPIQSAKSAVRSRSCIHCGITGKHSKFMRPVTDRDGYECTDQRVCAARTHVTITPSVARGAA